MKLNSEKLKSFTTHHGINDAKARDRESEVGPNRSSVLRALKHFDVGK